MRVHPAVYVVQAKKVALNPTSIFRYMDALEQGAADPSVYQRWFGLTDAGRVQKVASAFRNMDNNTLLGFTFNCGTAAPLCVPGVGAYVSPLQ